MTAKRKLLFSTLIMGFVFSLIEGSARLIWWGLERNALASTRAAGEEILRNDGINFMKEADGEYGYVLKADFKQPGFVINHARFHQQDEVPIARSPERFRVVCMGESTTFGNNVNSNYPHFLRTILNDHASGASGYEVINAGVPGWMSDQVAIRAERQLAAYKPDAAILYVGWNDFQSYSPFGPLAARSYFEDAYKGKIWKQYATGWLKSVALLSAAYHKIDRSAARGAVIASGNVTPEERYRFLLQSLDRIVTAFRQTNPDTRIYLSTLAGRWPHGTADEWAKIPSIWWMTEHKVTPEAAPALLEKFNDTLRRYAERQRLGVVEMSGAFADLDRARLQDDWAHMTPDGYELMAWTMFDALVGDGLVQRRGDPSRPKELRATYAVRTTVAAAVQASTTSRSAR